MFDERYVSVLLDLMQVLLYRYQYVVSSLRCVMCVFLYEKCMFVCIY